MHEYSVARALVGKVEAEARARGALAVRTVAVQIGELSGVNEELLRTAFDLCRGGTLCASARLALEPLPALWSCPRCGRPIEAGAELCCTACGERARLASGDELLLREIQMEVA